MEHLFTLLNAHPLLWVPFIIVARVMDVSLGTMRTIFVVRGHRLVASVLGLAEVIIWVIAVSGVLQAVTWLKILSYGVGFGLGNACGIWLEQKLAVGKQMVTLISPHRTNAAAAALRLAGYKVTELPAKGIRGSVAMCITVVSRRRTRQVLRIARQVDEEILSAVSDVRETTLIRRPVGGRTAGSGWRDIIKKK